MQQNTKKIKVSVGIITGRTNFVNVLKANIKDWKKTGLLYNPNISIDVFIAYDLKFSNLNEQDFKDIPQELIDAVDNITFLGDTEVNTMCEDIYRNVGISAKETKEIFGTHGYSKLRNTILYNAIKSNMDYLLFLDDDEYPYVVYKEENGTLKWKEQHTLLEHLKYIKNCDITYGYKCGYTSPIPYFDIGNEIEEKTLKNFIEIVSNKDSFKWKDIKDLMSNNKGITYGDGDKMAYETEVIDGGKWIWGTNTCFNLKRMKNIPPFYNPPEARGEDGFFSTCIKDKKVYRIPVYNFHDPFLKYSSVIDGIMPKKLEEVDEKDEKTMNRFLSASIGWIRYKPLLSYIVDEENYSKNINQLYKKIDICLKNFCQSVKMDEFYQIKDVLDEYHLNVMKHYKNFEKCKDNWNKILMANNTDNEIMLIKNSMYRNNVSKISKEKIASAV